MQTWFFFSRTYDDDFILKPKPLKSDPSKHVHCLLTHRRHLGNPGSVRAIQELGLIIIDVLNLDDELRLWLHGLVGEPVQRLGAERVVGLLLAVQPLGGMNIPRVLINNENGTRPFAWQDVFDGTISFINIGVKLVKNSCEMRLTYKGVSDTERRRNSSYVGQRHAQFFLFLERLPGAHCAQRTGYESMSACTSEQDISSLPINSLVSKGIVWCSQS